MDDCGFRIFKRGANHNGGSLNQGSGSYRIFYFVKYAEIPPNAR